MTEADAFGAVLELGNAAEKRMEEREEKLKYMAFQLEVLAKAMQELLGPPEARTEGVQAKVTNVDAFV